MRFCLLAGVLTLGLLAASPAQTYSVTTLADNTTTDGQCTLREAVDAANGTATGDCPATSSSDLEITFSVSGTILLGGTELSIGSDVAIDGGGTVTVDADSLSRIFHTLPATDVTLESLTIQEGKAPDAPDGAEEPGGDGGCILAEGNLTILNSTVTDCRAGDGTSFESGPLVDHFGTPGGSGGAVAALAELTITNSTISYGRAGDGGATMGTGGGILGGRGGFGGNIFANVDLTIEDSIVEHGRAGDGGDADARTGGGGGAGGGIFGSAGPQVIRNTVIRENVAGDGGSFGGAAGLGGGVYSDNGLNLEDSDVHDNVSGNRGSAPTLLSGGIAGGVYAGGTFVIERSSIRQNNTTPGLCNGGRCGDVGAGAGLFAGTGATGQVIDATISANAAAVNESFALGSSDSQGGGVYSRAASLTIRRSTITQNSLPASGGTSTQYDQFLQGSGIYVDAGTTTLESTIVAENSTAGSDNDVGTSGSGSFATSGFNLIGDPDDVTTFVDGVSDDQVGVTAPVVESIQFTSGSPAAVGFHPLVLGGPAIDAGTCGGSTSDVRGQTRPFDDPNITDADDGCDVGNVEMQQSGVAPVAGDCDANGQVDARDFIRWQSENGGSGLTCDMNNDSTVDFADFLIILNNNGL